MKINELPKTISNLLADELIDDYLKSKTKPSIESEKELISKLVEIKFSDLLRSRGHLVTNKNH